MNTLTWSLLQSYHCQSHVRKLESRVITAVNKSRRRTNLSLIRLLKCDVRIFLSSILEEFMCTHTHILLCPFFLLLLLFFFVKNLIQQMNLKNYTSFFPLLLAQLLVFLIREKRIRNRHCLLSEKMRFTISARWIRGERERVNMHMHTRRRIY